MGTRGSRQKHNGRAGDIIHCIVIPHTSASIRQVFFHLREHMYLSFMRPLCRIGAWGCGQLWMWVCRFSSIWYLVVLLSRVNLCGKVKLVCFDKTGTLTEDSMNVLGVMDVSDKRWVVYM